MAYCAKCGTPLGEGQQYCPNCGQPVGQAPAGVPTGAAPPPGPGAYAPAPSYPPAQSPYAPVGQPHGAGGWNPPPQRRGKGLWISLVAAVLVIAVACVLVFVVFKDDIFKGGPGSTPGQTVTRMLKAMEKQDVDALFDLMDQESLNAALGGISADAAKEMIGSVMFAGESVKFSGIEMLSVETSDTTATVTITQGTVTMTDSDGVKSTEDVQDATEPVTFDLIKKDGKWYLDANSLSSFGGDSSGSSIDGTTGTTAPDDAGAGQVTTTTSGGSVVTGQSTASSPEEAVEQFLSAMEDRDIMAVLAVMDPLTIEDSLGMSLEEAEQFIGGEMFDFDSIEFSGIKMSTEKTSETTATVTITGGTVTITDSTGTSTEDVRDADEPVFFDVLEIDGKWYLDPYGLF